MSTFRSSHRRCSLKKVIVRNFANFTGNTCARVFFNKVTGLTPATLFKKRHWHRCFPVNFSKFLRTPFLQKTSGELLLNIFSDGNKAIAFDYLITNCNYQYHLSNGCLIISKIRLLYFLIRCYFILFNVTRNNCSKFIFVLVIN